MDFGTFWTVTIRLEKKSDSDPGEKAQVQIDSD